MSKFNPIIAMLLLLLVAIALSITLGIGASRTNVGQAPASPVVVTASPTVPTETSVVASPTTLESTPPPPVGTVSNPLPTTVIGTSTPLPLLTATAEALMTRMAEYPPIPNLTPNPQEQERRAELEMLRSLYHLPGTITAQGSNTTPSGAFQLKTYRIEEIELPEPVTFTELTIGNITVDRVWRIVITGGPFHVGQQSLVLYIDGKPVASGYVSSASGDGVQFILFDDALLQEGAMIGVSLTMGVPLVTLPETLHFQP
ncbi:MAG TPA: hypothetical protein VJ183_05610 [Chloroflexia bacterium]|nr:hypothetical protein [Chloroflexia bacterium]